MALWTSGFVVLTLIINAPLMPWLLKVTGCVLLTLLAARVRLLFGLTQPKIICHPLCCGPRNLLSTQLANLAVTTLPFPECDHCAEYICLLAAGWRRQGA